MNWPKIIGWLIAIFAVWYIFSNPAGAGVTVQHLLHLLSRAGDSIAIFLQSL